MDEKRKLEKLLLADIENAVATHRKERASARIKVEDEALTKAPAKAISLLKTYVAAQAQIKSIAVELEALGYNPTNDYVNGYTLRVHYSSKPKLVREYDEQTASTEKALAELKRQYTLKLFAGGEEAQELFASLSRELAGIIF